MRCNINRILILSLVLAVFSLSNTLQTGALSQSHTVYMPVISRNQSGWLGPDGGSIVALAIDPSDPWILYAGTWGSGVYKSVDGGTSWQIANQGLVNLNINSLAIDPTQPSTIYAGTYRNQVYKSTNGGTTWTWSGAGMQEQAIVYTIAIDPLATSTLYAGTRGISNNGNPPWNGVVYKSIDAGRSWFAVLEDIGGPEAQDWVYSLAVNPNQEHDVFAATHEHGPYHSYDYGNSWHPILDGINDYSGRSIVVSPEKDSTTLYYGVWHTDTIYKSYNGGNDWFPSNREIQFTKVNQISLAPSNSDTIYLATFTHGVLKSTDGGIFWLPAGLDNDLIYTIGVNPLSSTDLFAGTAGDGIYHSQDGGVSWQQANNGIANAMVTAVIHSPSNPQNIFTGVYGMGVEQSNNGGTTWNTLNEGLADKQVNDLVMDPANPEVLYALTNSHGLYRNNLNENLGWESIGQGLPLSKKLTLAYPANHPFATLEMQENQLNSHQSLDPAMLSNTSLVDMAFSPSDPQIAYLATGGAGLYKTSDGGTSWLPAGLSGESILSIAVDGFEPGLVYAATSNDEALKVSIDGGNSWANISLGKQLYSLAASPTNPGVIYAGTSGGLYRNQSGTWTLLGLADHTVTAIGVIPDQDLIIYAGTTSGAYLTLDGGLSWNMVDDRLTNITVQSISIDANAPNYVYFGTKTHGIYLATLNFLKFAGN